MALKRSPARKEAGGFRPWRGSGQATLPSPANEVKEPKLNAHQVKGSPAVPACHCHPATPKNIFCPRARGGK
jgi:hypothetical protein